MALIESLLTAIVRADGDALVMHVGEKPYVVAASGPIALSSQALTLQAMAGMVTQLLPEALQPALTEFGAVEHELPSLPVMHDDRFTLVVARGGDDVWIEFRRHRQTHPIAPPPVVATIDQAPPLDAATDGHVAATLPVDAMSEVPAVSAPLSWFNPPITPAASGASTSREQPEPVPQPAEGAHTEQEPEMEQIPEPNEAAATEPVVDPAIFRPPTTAAEPLSPAEEPSPVEPTVRVPVTTPAAAEAPSSTAASASTAPPDPEATHAPVAEMQTEHPLPPSPQSAAPASPPASSTASVIPMTRTLRIEVPRSPSRPSSSRADIERLLGLAAARGATTLYLTTQASPFLRVDDDVQVIDGEPPMTAADIEAAVLELMPDTARDAVRRGDPVEWVSELPEIGRLRCSTFRDYRGPGAIFQWHSFRPVTAAQLGLNDEIQALATETEGLVLIASPRGHGKSTLIGAFVDLINHQRSGYVITLERQIRLVHDHDQALISQREARGTADQVLSVARAALSENADVLVVDELPSAEVFQLALDAAGSGRLVIVSVAAPSITTALARLVGLFPTDQRKEILSLLADRLRGAVAQVLLRKTAGGRVAAREVVLATAAVGRVLADGQLQDLPLAIDSGRKHGLTSLTDSLVQLVRSGVIDAREAYRKADDRDALLVALKRENVDTTQVERLA